MFEYFWLGLETTMMLPNLLAIVLGVLIGLVLGNIAENGLINGISVTRGDFGDFFIRPITVTILLISLFFLVSPLIIDYISSRKKQKAAESQ